MIETSILALSDKYALSGIFCLAAIPCLIIALIPYAKGVIAGAGTNFILMLLAIFGTADPQNAVDGVFVNAVGNNDWGYITNKSQTKWMKRPGGYALDEDGAMFLILERSYPDGSPKREAFFIPAEETKIVDGWIVMKATGKRAEDDDYYICTV